MQGTVLARPAVQNIESDVRFDRAEHDGDIAAHVYGGHPIAEARESRGTSFAGEQRNLPLGRPASHQNGNVLAHAGSGQTADSLHPNRIENRSRVESLC